MLTDLIDEAAACVSGRVKKFTFDAAGFTPYGVDFVAGDRIEHPQWGIGTVMISGIEEGKAAYEARLRGLSYQPLTYRIQVRFDSIPEGAMCLKGPNTVELRVKPAERPNLAVLSELHSRPYLQAQSSQPG